MKKTISFMILVLVMAVALTGTGCKSRDVKALALGLGPVPAAAPGLPCGATASFQVLLNQCTDEYNDETTGAESGPFTECGFSGTQKIYQIVVTEGDVYYFYAYSYDSNIAMSLRRSCNPGGSKGDVVTCYNDYWYQAWMDPYLEPGTYFLVVDTQGDASGFYFEICNGVG